VAHPIVCPVGATKPFHKEGEYENLRLLLYTLSDFHYS